MKISPAGLGATRKKTVILIGIVVVGVPLVYWMNSSSETPAQPGPSSSNSSPAAARPAIIPAMRKTAEVASPMPPKRTATRDGGRTTDEYHPTMKPPENMDISRIDPTVNLELLAKVREVPVEGGTRSLFEFYTPPPPPVPPPKVDPIKPGAVKPGEQTPIEPPKPAGPPPPPPITLKYYGYAGTASRGSLKACFLDGDPTTGEIYVAGENEMVKNRYKIIRIGVKSAVVEDTANKNQQTLPLVTEEGG